MANVQNQEPIFWVNSSSPQASNAERHRSIVDENGRRRLEKHPQIGHVGPYDDYKTANGVRFYVMCRHDGNIVFHCLTNGAAHLDHNGPYGQYAMMKARYLGWFLPSECPCALVAAQTIEADTLVHAPNRTANPCKAGTYSYKNPCEHAVAEIAARRLLAKEIDDERRATMPKDVGDALPEAIREQTKTLISVLGAKAEAEGVGLELPPPPADAPKGKKT